MTMAGLASCFSLFGGVVWGVEVDVDGTEEEVVVSVEAVFADACGVWWFLVVFLLLVWLLLLLLLPRCLSHRAFFC